MKNLLNWFAVYVAATFILVAQPASASGLPEPGLVMYGAVRNTANSNARIVTGTISWTLTTASGSPVTITTPLTDISGQYSYAVRVPFESVVGSSTLSPNTFKLNSANTTYIRTNVSITINGSNYTATMTNGSFTFNTSARGRLEQVDLTVNAPSVPGYISNPSFASAQRLSNGQFQLSINGNIGQSYNLLASSDLVAWTNIKAFIATNAPMVILDPSATNYPKRFYRISQ